MITKLLNKTKLVRELRRELQVANALKEMWRKECDERDRAVRPARFRLDGGMTPEAIANQLAGSHELPHIKAVMAHVGAKIVVAVDIATDAPRERDTSTNRTIPGYTEEMRLHDAGRASAFAETLADLQELTAARPVAETAKAAASEEEEGD